MRTIRQGNHWLEVCDAKKRSSLLRNITSRCWEKEEVERVRPKVGLERWKRNPSVRSGADAGRWSIKWSRRHTDYPTSSINKTGRSNKIGRERKEIWVSSGNRKGKLTARIQPWLRQLEKEYYEASGLMQSQHFSSIFSPRKNNWRADLEKKNENHFLYRHTILKKKKKQRRRGRGRRLLCIWCAYNT